MIAGLILWIIGIPVAIWRPREAPRHSWRGRAYRAIRRASGWLLAAYLLLVLPDLGAIDDTLPMALLSVISTAAIVLWPLATAALALDMRRRWLALPATFVAVLLAAGLTWLALVTAIVSFMHPAIPTWRGVVAAASAILGMGACAFVLEVYALTRRPDPA